MSFLNCCKILIRQEARDMIILRFCEMRKKYLFE